MSETAPHYDVAAIRAKHDEVPCPGCGRLMPRSRLLRDIYGVPRCVDVSVYPCADCLRRVKTDAKSL